MLLLAGAVLTQRTAAQQNLTFALFDRYLESLRVQAGIPGLSAAIVVDRSIAWEKGFGLQDVDRVIVPTPSTPYLVGDLTQIFGATLVLDCVEDSDVSLSDRLRRWTDKIPEPQTTVREVLSHTGPGGFRYDPARFAALTDMIGYCRQQAYPRILADRVLDRLAMFSSVPGHDLEDSGAATRGLFDQSHLDRYSSIVAQLAVPYRVDRNGRPTRSDYPARGLNAATGLISTVRDLALFDAALDDAVIVGSDLRAASWTNSLTTGGSLTPMGLGWFVQSYNGQRVIWHFGLIRDAFSSLMIKVPGRNVSLILLANSDGLSAPFPLANGDVTVSVFAQLFLRTFVP